MPGHGPVAFGQDADAPAESLALNNLGIAYRNLRQPDRAAATGGTRPARHRAHSESSSGVGGWPDRLIGAQAGFNPRRESH
jgi:hypothetical protein